MKSLKKSMGPFLRDPKRPDLLLGRKKTPPGKNDIRTSHMRLKKRFKNFVFRISFHSIQEKRFFILSKYYKSASLVELRKVLIELEKKEKVKVGFYQTFESNYSDSSLPKLDWFKNHVALL